MRISDINKSQICLKDLYKASNEYNDILGKLSANKNYLKYSDNPIEAQKSLYYNDEINANDVYKENANEAKDFASFTETAINNVESLLDRLNELTKQAANGTLNDAGRTAIAQESNELINEMVRVGNEKYNGIYVFAGQKNDKEPFTLNGSPPTGVVYNGDDKAITYKVSEDSKIDVNISGNEFLTKAINDTINFKNHVEAGDTNSISSVDIDAMDKDLNNLLSARTKLGAKQQILTDTISRIDDNTTDVKTSLANAEDVNVPQAISNMYMQQNIYESCLSIISKIEKLNLADYL